MEETKKSRRGEAAGEVERLSDLPDSILLHVFSFVNTLDAVKTCVLSKKWRHLWRHIPTLILHSSNFQRLERFRKFVSMVMSGRHGTIPLHNLNFECRRGCGRVQTRFLDSVINYAVSHNVKQLTLSVRNYSYCPPRLFSYSSLTSLEIEAYETDIILPKSLDLPALTSLHLGHYVKFSADDNGRAEPFGNCSKLKTLIIKVYTIKENKGVPGTLCIANDSLTNLSIGNSYRQYYAPKIELFTPNLKTFAVKADHLVQMIQFSGQNLDFLEEADIDIMARDVALPSSRVTMRRKALIFMDMLQLLSSVKSMTITSSTLKVLSYVYASLETQRPCFSNLKSLKVIAYSYRQISNGVLDYLLQNSPMAEVTFIDRRKRWP